MCENTIGLYRCSCKEGFTLASDNATCKGNAVFIDSIMCIISFIIAKTPCPNEPSKPLLCALLQNETETYACIKGYIIQTNNQICTGTHLFN